MPKKRADGRYSRSFRLADGTRKYVYGANRVEVDRSLAEAKRQAERGELVRRDTRRVDEYLDYWLSVKRMTLSAGSYVQYVSRVRAHLAPRLGHLPLQRLTQAQVQRFVMELVDEDYASATIHGLYKTLKTALSDAVEWQLLAFNPCRRVKLPKIEQPEMAALDEVQAQTLLQVVRGTDVEALVTVALATGMRYGELCGLKWADIDLDHAVVRVQRQLCYINGQGYVEQAPKTRGSRRSIVLTGFAVEMLRKHRTCQKAQRMGAKTWENRDLVFCAATGGYFSHVSLLRHFRKLLAQADLPPIRFHDLRHSVATLLLKMRVPGKVVQEILGHSSISITMNKYGHILPGMQEEAIGDLDRLLSEGKREAN